MKNTLVWSVFWAQFAVFVFIIVVMVSPANPFGTSLHPGFIFIPWGVFFCLGAALLFLTLRQKVAGAERKFLLLTGAAGVGFLVSVLLHGLISGLFDVEEAFFFVLATVICPLGFLVGAVGGIVLGVRNRFHRQPVPGN
jgi:hypothetical protein